MSKRFPTGRQKLVRQVARRLAKASYVISQTNIRALVELHLYERRELHELRGGIDYYWENATQRQKNRVYQDIYDCAWEMRTTGVYPELQLQRDE